MSKFIKQFQNIIHSKMAHEAGYKKTKEATIRMLGGFSNDIMDAVMSPGEKTYLIQWAISELNEDEDGIDAPKES